MRRRTTSGWRTASAAVAIGLAALGMRPPAVPAGEFTSPPLVADRASPGSKENAKAIGRETAPMSGGPHERQTPEKDALSRGRRYAIDAEEMKSVNDGRVLHVGRVVGSTAVSTNRGPAARSAGNLGLGDPCNCDEDCDGALGDKCNIVQCIVRGVCSLDASVPCSTAQAGGSADADCEVASAGTCLQNSFRQRCDVVQLIGWPCDVDSDFCTMDQCEDDGTGTRTSVCIPQDDGAGSPLSACPKQCAGGPAAGRRCTQSGDCPQGSCEITLGGGCDSAAEACYVGIGDLATTAIGRCCTNGTCSETNETTCTSGGGAWYRYRDPAEQVGNGNCLCPKYGSGVAPAGTDEGSIGLVRPSGLVCTAGSAAADLAGLDPVYCEDPDGDGLAPQFCLRRCVGGDDEGALCETDNPDCSRLGFCSMGGLPCLMEVNGADCGLCEGLDNVGCDDFFFPCPGGETCLFEGGQTCIPGNPGTCLPDLCASNPIEGGCEDGFLNIGDDYSVGNGSFLRLSRVRFRGGVSNQGEDIVLEFWDSTGTHLVDSIAVNDLDRVGTRDWTIEVDCWPNCDPAELEAPAAIPVIIPPNGYLVMRSTRTIGTLDGATAFWNQTDAEDVGTNDAGKSWVNGDPNADVGTNVYIFELVGVKVPEPLGACCDDGLTCEDTLRWQCGICSGEVGGQLCADTLHDCPQGGLTGSLCRFHRWFGPVTHADFGLGGGNGQLCDGISPCDKGACCQGGPGGICTEETQAQCGALGGEWRGVATDCSPNCCPVANPTGSDCICATSTCVVDAGGTNTGFVCDPANGDADCESGQTCTLQCEPNGVTLLRHPYECHDDFGSPLEPPIPCDPTNADADCTVINPLYTCEQSFSISTTTTRTDTIASTFGVLDGEACSLNTATDRVGWFERFTLVDPTPGDGTDDCFVLTVSMCCTDPVLRPVWAFVSEYLECPCLVFDHVLEIPLDSDFDNNVKGGFGPGSRANFPCDDENFAGTFTVPPGDYAYQVRAGRLCVGSSPAQGCETDDDCDGVACELATPDYTLHFTVESCQLAACCVNETCIVTNKLDCLAREGNFLGDGDQPVNTCQTGSCNLGSCCLVGQCRDDSAADTFAECEALGGVFQGGMTCDMNTCPTCPFAGAASCQEVQTTFGQVPHMDRNPANGPVGETASVLADDVKFGGDVVDKICWNTGFFQTPCCQTRCVQNIDETWEIRVYETDSVCPGIPDVEIGVSTITVLNKLEGTGSATGTWHYGGVLNTPIALPNGGLAGDTYWFEVSGFGEPGCEVRAIWSRDDGNDHHAVSTWTAPEPGTHPYSSAQIGSVDVGFCESSGLGTPPDVLGACCTCSAEGPGICAENFTQKACVEQLRGVWVPCIDCSDATGICPGEPVNDDCTSPLVITSIPTDGSELVIEGDNICATTDGPGLMAGDGGCASSLWGGADLHHDVWYSYVAEACGELTIDSCADTDYDQMIAVYDATNGCPLLRTDEIGCGDDTCGSLLGPSKVTVDVAEGQALLVRVGGWGIDIPESFMPNPRGNFTLRFSFDENCPPCQSPFMPSPPHDILKNRYISIGPNPCDPVLGASDIQVTLVSTQVSGVTAIGSTWWAAAPDADCISIVSSARPKTPPDWSVCPTVHLTGCPIIPTSTYHIRTVLDEIVFDPPLVAETQAKPGIKWHGDCVGFFTGTVWTTPNGQTSIDDAVAAIKTFQNPSQLPGCPAPPCNATHVSVTDMVPNLPGGPQINSIVNIADVFSIILGFRGEEYPGSQIELCP